MEYCGVVTPFRGIRVYARPAMGMPGSKTALEELMCHVPGDLLEAGSFDKIADHLFCVADSHEELLNVCSAVLLVLDKSDLQLSAPKTSSTTILGWVWSSGHLGASPHQVATRSSCHPPTTVKGLRSFVGTYKRLPCCPSWTMLVLAGPHRTVYHGPTN